MAKNPPANAGDVGLIPGSGRSPGGGHGNPLQYPCLENSMDKRVWQAACSPWDGKNLTQTPNRTYKQKFSHSLKSYIYEIL